MARSRRSALPGGEQLVARYLYGAAGASQVVGMDGHPMTSPATAKTARTLGSTVSDIQNLAGLGLGGIVTPDSYGQVIFYGPDNYTDTIWLDFGSGPRWGVNPILVNSQIDNRLMEKEVAAQASPDSYTAKSSLPYMNNTIGADQMAILDGMTVPKYADGAARSAANPTPADGDRAFMQDTHVSQTYSSQASRWVAGPQLLAEYVFPNSTTNSVTFSSIPQTHKHLMVVYNGRCSAVGSGGTDVMYKNVRHQFNGDVAGGSYRLLVTPRKVKVASGTSTYGVSDDGTGGTTTGSTAVRLDDTFVSTGATGALVGYIPGSSTLGTSQGGGSYIIYDYANTSMFKSWSGDFGWAAGTTTAFICEGHIGGTYSGTLNAVTSLTLLLTSSGTWGTGSRVSLYGLS